MEGLDLVYPGKEETERLYQQYAVHREWIVARDRFLDSENVGAYEFNRAIAFAANGIAEAQWLRTTFNSVPPLGRRHLIETLHAALERDPNDVLALTYLAHFHRVNDGSVRVAAERGNAVAQYMCGRRTGQPEWYVRAAKQDHAGALEVCAMERHTNSTKAEMLPIAARGAIMGSFWCMDAYANLCFTRLDQEFWIWKLRATLYPGSYMRNGLSYSINSMATTTCIKNVYALGSTIKTPEGKAFWAKEEYVPTGYTKAIQVYKDVHRAARAAILTWMVIARHKGLYKDVAQMIGKLVWSQGSDFCSIVKGYP